VIATLNLAHLTERKNNFTATGEEGIIDSRGAENDGDGSQTAEMTMDGDRGRAR
jgi:hypothetical protein